MGKSKLTSVEKFFLERIEYSFYNDINGILGNPANFKLSAPIAIEAINKFIIQKDLIESTHKKMKGTDPFKIAGYLAFWIAILKPIMILEPDPKSYELEVNELLGISFAFNFLLEETGQEYILSQKIIDDLRYSLRYRIVTLRTLPIIFESFFAGCAEGNFKRK